MPAGCDSTSSRGGGSSLSVSVNELLWAMVTSGSSSSIVATMLGMGTPSIGGSGCSLFSLRGKVIGEEAGWFLSELALLDRCILDYKIMAIAWATDTNELLLPETGRDARRRALDDGAAMRTTVAVVGRLRLSDVRGDAGVASADNRRGLRSFSAGAALEASAETSPL